MKDVLVRLVNVILILAVLFVFNAIVAERNNAEEAAYAKAIEKASEVEEWNNKILAEAEEKSGSDSKDSSGYTDGTYEGKADGFGGAIEVAVSIESGKLLGIEVKSAKNEDEAYFAMAKDIIDVIIKEQSTDVDTISGATFSSTGIKNAVANALEGAQ